MIKKISLWIKKNPWELGVLASIILLAAFLRFYRIDEYMIFLGDEGRDAIVVKDILTGTHLPSLGPPMSVGNVYLGPLYYYMMAFAMGLFWLNPVAAAGMVALIGVLAVALIYYLSREWFGKVAAAVAALGYALSPVAINYSRFSWNPNPVPFFSLLSILGLYRTHKSGNANWFILTGASLAFLLQMHYLALIMVPVVLLLWVYELSLRKGKKSERNSFWLASAISLLAFLTLMSPLIFFDIRHNFLNARGLYELFFSGGSGVKLTFLDTFGRSVPLFVNDLVGRYLAGQNPIFAALISLAALSILADGVYRRIRGERLSWPLLALSVWLFFGLVGLMFYKGAIYDHYLGALSPVPFILFGAFYQTVWNQRNSFRPIAITLALLFLALVSFAEVLKNPLLAPPNRQLQRTQEIARFIIRQSGGKPFNFALLAKNNYDSAYQYYLDIYGYKPRVVPFEKTDQLFVVCEDAVCNPIGHPKYEIAAFGWSQIKDEYRVDGLRVFKLIPNPDQPNR